MGSRRFSAYIAAAGAILAALLAATLFDRTSPMSGTSYKGPFLPLAEEEIDTGSRLHRHVVMLAETVGERNIWRKESLYEAAAYIEGVWQEQGFAVERQKYETRGVTSANLIVEIPGTSRPGEIVVVGAHYDSVLGSPGANDNGSGVAALLEISRLLVGQQPARTIRLAAFTNEEPPFFLRRSMGSRVYAARARSRGEDIVAMLSLETMGFYSEAPGSQEYPFPFSFFYPDTANFIGFVGNVRSRSLVQFCLGAFRRTTRFPSEGTAVPGWITGIGWSDHWSFWREGYRAIMVTDTAFFRYRHYHTGTDTPEKLDYGRLARVTHGLAEVIVALAAENALR